MNKAIFLNSNESNYYLNDEFVFSAKRKTGLKYFIKTLCNINDGEKNILEFSYFSFFPFFKIKILNQDFEKKIFINKKGLRYDLVFNENKVSIIHNINPFSKKICKIYLNEDYAGEIIRQLKSSKTNYIFEFLPTFNYRREAMLCFIINCNDIQDTV